ncbi:MAG: UDP-N-acetylmuramate:L-alanyl-gamma-D-glutamyl-meso-diaminopimelate ligase [Chromatiales bacterium]|nr:UDP-N-acetylmuramate:L-alanyl-gamma-D-glutamyl-meso-diaminopimelate ligase [Chromatiales bacterium]
MAPHKGHVHILGICGTFMGGIALLAKAAGYKVTGSDANVYPPMSTQLREQGIELSEGYEVGHLQPAPDWVVVGNALSRGNPAVEYMLAQGLPYTSGPQWLAEHLLQDRWVLAVAGTHGKTTTSSMLAWILDYAGLDPGFLVGGVPLDFGLSARAGQAPFFVVEADEYDTAFFDKRSKFVHYRPRTAILNNLEFDHADIFDDLTAIQRQFHHLVRTVPGNGLIVRPECDEALDQTLSMGCWTPTETFGEQPALWHAELLQADSSRFRVFCGSEDYGVVDWIHGGEHNRNNALAALAAARHAGVPGKLGVEALCRFRGVRRRMELRGEVNGVRVYDDFAHHPTAIATTLAGLRAARPEARIVAVLEPRSNTMRMGVHRDQLAPSLKTADQVILYTPPGLDWNLDDVAAGLGGRGAVFRDIDEIVAKVASKAGPGDCILVMSNGGFGGIHQRLLDALEIRP